jgi:hypothetical protein
VDHPGGTPDSQRKTSILRTMLSRDNKSPRNVAEIKYNPDQPLYPERALGNAIATPARVPPPPKRDTAPWYSVAAQGNGRMHNYTASRLPGLIRSVPQAPPQSSNTGPVFPPWMKKAMDPVNSPTPAETTPMEYRYGYQPRPQQRRTYV